MSLNDAIVELYRTAATSLPPDVETALRAASDNESGSASGAVSILLQNIERAKTARRPVCQDTGMPVFFVQAPFGVSHAELKREIQTATRVATKAVPLRANAVDILTDRNSGDNTGEGFPLIFIEECRGTKLIIDLMLKGSGSENIGQLYRLPLEELKADRDLEGVRRCVLDAVHKAQGRGCPPYCIGVGIGGAKDQVTSLSKRQLLRRLDDSSVIPLLAELEKSILDEINSLGIGPLGLGGRTTALSVKIAVNHRHPASFFVDVSFSCWADRRASLIWETAGSFQPEPGWQIVN